MYFVHNGYRKSVSGRKITYCSGYFFLLLGSLFLIKLSSKKHLMPRWLPQLPCSFTYTSFPLKWKSIMQGSPFSENMALLPVFIFNSPFNSPLQEPSFFSKWIKNSYTFGFLVSRIEIKFFLF